MKSDKPNVIAIIDYLESKLCKPPEISYKSYQFKKVGPRSFFFADETDTIFVKVTDNELIIITDGKHVIDGTTMTHITPYMGEDIHHWIAIMEDSYVQPILHKF